MDLRHLNSLFLGFESIDNCLYCFSPYFLHRCHELIRLRNLPFGNLSRFSFSNTPCFEIMFCELASESDLPDWMISVAFNLALEMISAASDSAFAMVFSPRFQPALSLVELPLVPFLCTYGAMATDEEFMMITTGIPLVHHHRRAPSGILQICPSLR